MDPSPPPESGPPESGEQPPEPLDVEIALLDTFGVIVSVNEAWHDFAVRNGADL